MKVILISGSSRVQSSNKQLLAITEELLRKRDVATTIIDPKNYPLPLYDGDLEADQGIPENAMALARLIAWHDAVIFASPEYNGSLSAVLKNTLDWISRPNRENLTPLHGKKALLMCATASAAGGLSNLNHLHTILERMGAHCIPEKLVINRAYEELADLSDEKTEALNHRLASVLDVFINIHKTEKAA